MIEKSKDLQIYVLAHKMPPYGLPDDEFHTPIHCGRALSDSEFCELGDDSGDNISEKNPWFLEDTGIYWIWKNDSHPYVGHFQYRRHLELDPNKIKEIVDEHGIIVPEPLHFLVSVKQHYCVCHIKSDIDLCGDIIKELYPDYVESWTNAIVHGHDLYYSSAFITTRENYERICDFVFGVLFEFEKRLGYKTKEDWIEHGNKSFSLGNTHRGEITNSEYQARVCGYLFERLFTLYVVHNFKNPYRIKYTLKENIEV